MKLTFCITLILACSLSVQGADISAGTTYLANSQVTAPNLNALVGNATINSAFITAKSSATPDGAGVFIYYDPSAGGLRKVTLNTFLLANTSLITGQVEDTTPANNDLVLTYDTSGAVFKKVQLLNLFSVPTNLFSGFPTITVPLLTDLVPLSSSSTNARITISNLFNQFPYTAPFTNLTVKSTPGSNDFVLIRDTDGGTNKETSLGAIKTNVFYQTFTSPQFTFAVSVNTTNAHNLPGKPQFARLVLVCTNFDVQTAYTVGDEVDISSIDEGTVGSGQSCVTYGVNSSNYFVLVNNTSLATLATKTNASRVSTITAVNWNYKLYLNYFRN